MAKLSELPVTTDVSDKLLLLLDPNDFSEAPTGTDKTINSDILRNRSNHTGEQAISTITNLQSLLDGKINTSEKGASNGVAELDANGNIASSQLPTFVSSVVGGQDITVDNTDPLNPIVINDQLFGREFQSVQDLTISTITSNSFTNKLTLNLTGLEGGNYMIGVFANWNLDTTTSDFEGELVVDGGRIPGYPTAWNSSGSGTIIIKQEPKDSSGNVGGTGSDQSFPLAWQYGTLLSSGAHTIELNRRPSNNNVEASIWGACLFIFRLP